MIIAVLIALLVGLIILGSGLFIWFVSRQRLVTKSREPAKPASREPTSIFRWSYVALPVAVLLFSIILVAIFSPKLPTELAYRFNGDGSPDRWLNRSQFLLITLLPQFILTLLAAAITWGVTKLSRLLQSPESLGSNPKNIIRVMGNMMALPQIILSFAMLDIFSYNSYQIHIMPLWIFALITMGAGGIVLAIFFLRAAREAWQTTQ
tara:strand:- start:249 stop:869 length:621 start_codon:yes stop_codon:yes gene_type:complete